MRSALKIKTCSVWIRIVKSLSKLDLDPNMLNILFLRILCDVLCKNT